MDLASSIHLICTIILMICFIILIRLADKIDTKQTKNRKEYKKYSKEELIEMLEDIDRPIEEPCQVAVLLCEMWSCKNCPCTTHKADKRTDEEHDIGYTCQEQLWNWIIGKDT